MEPARCAAVAIGSGLTTKTAVVRTSATSAAREPAFILIRKLNGWDHKTACDEIDRILGESAIFRPALTEKPARNRGNGSALARS